MKSLQKGFTLIELMIVVAIIGILAAIALPAYQDYIARTQASEAFKATSGLQTDIAVYLADQNAYPDAAEVTNPTGVIGNLAFNLEGKYFGQGDIVVQAGTGKIGIVFNNGANGTAGSERGMMITPVATLSGQVAGWVCAGAQPTGTVTAASAPLEDKRLPSSCQSAITVTSPFPGNGSIITW